MLRFRWGADLGDTHEKELELHAGMLADEAQFGGYWSYAAGVAYVFVTEYHVGGLEIDNYLTTLPMKKGLSSSAALCVLVARAFNETYGLGLTTRGEMQAAYVGERLTPSQCGRMDQAVAFGSTPVIMSYSGDVLQVQPLKTLGASLHIVLVDLCASKDTVKILSSLQQAYPHPQTPQHEALVRLLGSVNADLVLRAEQALAAGDLAALGALMRQSQECFDAVAGPLCPDQLGHSGSPMLHRVLDYPAIQHLVWGGKGVGSQGDGTAQLLCRGPGEQQQVCKILEEDLSVKCLNITLPALKNSGEVHEDGFQMQTKKAIERQIQRLEAVLNKMKSWQDT